MMGFLSWALLLGGFLLFLYFVVPQLVQDWRHARIRRQAVGHWTYPANAPGTGTACAVIEGMAGDRAPIPPFEEVYFHREGILIDSTLYAFALLDARVTQVDVVDDGRFVRVRLAVPDFAIEFAEELMLSIPPHELAGVAELRAALIPN